MKQATRVLHFELTQKNKIQVLLIVNYHSRTRHMTRYHKKKSILISNRLSDTTHDLLIPTSRKQRQGLLMSNLLSGTSYDIFLFKLVAKYNRFKRKSHRVSVFEIEKEEKAISYFKLSC